MEDYIKTFQLEKYSFFIVQQHKGFLFLNPSLFIKGQ
jgi:hypothetical protein